MQFKLVFAGETLKVLIRTLKRVLGPTAWLVERDGAPWLVSGDALLCRRSRLAPTSVRGYSGGGGGSAVDVKRTLAAARKALKAKAPFTVDTGNLGDTPAPEVVVCEPPSPVAVSARAPCAALTAELRAALAFAGQDPARPGCLGVTLRAVGGLVFVDATDGHSAFASSVALAQDDAGREGVVRVSRAHVRAWLDTADEVARGEDAPAVVRGSSERVTLRVPSEQVSAIALPGSSIPARPVDGPTPQAVRADADLLRVGLGAVSGEVALAVGDGMIVVHAGCRRIAIATLVKSETSAMNP